MHQAKPLAAQLQTAIELHQLGRLEEARERYRQILERQPQHADALHLLAVSLIQSASASQALPLLEQAIALNNTESSYHASLGRAYHALSDYEQAIAPLRRAAQLTPGNAQYWCDLGATLQSAGQVNDAQEVYERALRIDPGHATSRYNLATVLHDHGDLGGAIGLLKSLLGDDPGGASLHSTLAGYLLESDEISEALAESDAALALNPRDLMAMSFKSIALLRLGDLQGARHLVDFERLIVTRTINAPPGYASLNDFNIALEHHVLNHPTLVFERRQNATRGGRHTSNLLLGDKGPMADLETVFNTHIQQYLNQLPRDPGHPYLALRPPAWSLQAWAVVMDKQGHQLAHTHPEGWVSGVYYLSIPAAVNATDPQQAGWIEFGRPLPELIGTDQADVRRYQPQAGLLVLFPSYFYHETIPFESATQRISIAFDAIPRGRRQSQ